MPDLLCPKCGAGVPSPAADADTPCPECKFELPFQYVQGCRTAPPVWVVAIGYPEHGKSSLTRGLMMSLWSSNLTRRFGITALPCGSATSQKLKAMVERDRQGLPEPRTDGHDVYLLSARGLGGAGSRTLVLHDVRGQLFEQLDAAQAVAALKTVQTVWMVVSPKELSESSDRRLDLLFQTYTNALSRLGVSAAGRTVVVVYTKADTFDKFPPEVTSYYSSCPFREAVLQKAEGVTPDRHFAVPAYLNALDPVSQELRDWTGTRPGGAAFLLDADEQRVNLHFCVTSSIGGKINPQTQKLEHDRRSRVLDPLLLTMATDRPVPDARSGPRVALLLDAAAGSDPVYADGLPARLTNALQRYGRVVTYHLGATTPAVDAKRPAQVPFRLIGPIVEREPADTQFLVVTAGRPVDLFDFYGTERRNRITVLAVGGYQEAHWPRVVRPSADPVERLLAPYFPPRT